MRIGVNLLYLRVDGVGGSEVYARNVIDELARIGKNRVTVFGWEAAAATFEPSTSLRFVPVASGTFSQARRLFAENVALARQLASDAVDVLFSPANFAAPLLPRQVPQVATIHDLQHLHFPHHFRPHQRVIRSALFRATAAVCRELIAVSEYTRKDFVAAWGAAGAQIHVVPEGVTKIVRPSARDCERVREKHGLIRPYLYYPAMLAPHKNHGVLLKAFSAALHGGVGDLDLVLTGGRSEALPELERTAEMLGVRARVRHLGWIDRREVLPVMCSARALVYPSLFEGFGLPLLEAMQCDVPVVASDATSIPEVVGDAALLVPPLDGAAWERAIVAIVRDDALRAELVARGTRNVERFSWQRCAVETQAVLERCCAGEPGRAPRVIPGAGGS